MLQVYGQWKEVVTKYLAYKSLLNSIVLGEKTMAIYWMFLQFAQMVLFTKRKHCYYSSAVTFDGS